MKNICVIGVGYVGLVTGACLADMGNRVVCLNRNKQKSDNLKKGILPIYEPGLEEVVRRNSEAGRLGFTTSYDEAMQDAEFIFIAVGTPSGDGGEADLAHVRAAATEVARRIHQPVVIINKSTVHDGLIEEYCAGEGIPILGKIPYSRDAAQRCSRGELLAETDPATGDVFRRILEEVTACRQGSLQY